MKFLPFVLKHLRRNWIRTAHHGAGHGRLHLPLLHAADGAGRRSTTCSSSTSANRLVTRHAVSLVFNLPLSYADAHRGRARRQARGHHLLVRRLAARQEGGQGRGRRREPPRTGATSSRTWRWTRSPTSRCTRSSRSRPTSTRPSWRTCRARHRPQAREQVRLEGRRPLLPGELHPALPQAERALRVRGARHLRRRPREAPEHRHQPHVLPLQVPLRGHRAARLGRAPTPSRSTIPHQAGDGQQGHRRPVREQRRARPTPRPSRPSRPASSPWPATWPCSSTASAWP